MVLNKLNSLLITVMDATPPPTGTSSALWDNIKSMLTNIVTGITIVVPIAAVIAMIVVGIMYIIGSDLAQRAPQRLRQVVLGSLIALGASAIVAAVQNLAAFL